VYGTRRRCRQPGDIIYEPAIKLKYYNTAIKDPYAILRKKVKTKCDQHTGVWEDSKVGDQLIIVAITTLGSSNSTARDYFKCVAMGRASITQDTQNYRMSFASQRFAAKIVQNSMFCLTEGIEFDSNY